MDDVSNFCQVFVYRVPKENHDRFAEAERQLAAIFKKCGVIRSDFYVVEDARIFRGFQDLRETLGAATNEEVWIEIDHYRDAEDSVRVIGEIGKEPAAGPLFGQILALSVPDVSWPQANAQRLQL